MQPGDLFGPVLVDHVAVGHLERVGVPEVDLVLAEARLTLRELHRDAGVVDAVADRPDEVLVAGGLEDVVVLDVRAVRREAGVTLRGGFLVGVAEQDELQLRATLDRVPGFLRPRDLAPQDLARRDLDRLAGGRVEEIAEDERGLLQPRQHAQRGGVGSAEHVAVARLPTREAVSGNGRHVDVDREEVAARVDPVLGDMSSVEPSRHSLPHEAALQIGEGDDDGVDLVGIDEPAQLLDVGHRAKVLASSQVRVKHSAATSEASCSPGASGCGRGIPGRREPAVDV